jgi:hypothetical protein
MVLSIIFLEDKHKILLHLSIFYECQQFFQHRICFSIQPPGYGALRHFQQYFSYTIQGRIQDFKLGGAHLKKLRRVVGGAKIVLVFRVKNRDFTPKNLIFSNFMGGCADSFT